MIIHDLIFDVNMVIGIGNSPSVTLYTINPKWTGLTLYLGLQG
jgi:hypothetical protein